MKSKNFLFAILFTLFCSVCFTANAQDPITPPPNKSGSGYGNGDGGYGKGKPGQGGHGGSNPGSGSGNMDPTPKKPDPGFNIIEEDNIQIESIRDTIIISNKPEQPKYEIKWSAATNTISCGDHTYRMIHVPGGTFKMGATPQMIPDDYDPDSFSDELPVHDVTLSDYYIGQTEVPQWLWVAVMGSNPSGAFDEENHPVDNVSYDMCISFFQRLNEITGAKFSLPTEAQWEYAARGGKDSRGFIYSGGNNINKVGWYSENVPDKTQAVGRLAPNELEIYDMTGNVREWVSDYFGPYPSLPQTNPTGPLNGRLRVIRGGDWLNDAIYGRISYRAGKQSGQTNSNNGFRIALQ